jgi:hypothetical protein
VWILGTAAAICDHDLPPRPGNRSRAPNRPDRKRARQDPTKGVRFDRHVDDVLAATKAGQAVFDGGDRIAGTLDYDLDSRMRNQLLIIVANVCRPHLEGVIQ